MCQDGWSRWDAPEKVGDTAQDLPDRWIWDLSSPERRCWQQGQRVQVCGWVSPSRILGFGSKFQLFPLVLSLQEEWEQLRDGGSAVVLSYPEFLAFPSAVPGQGGPWNWWSLESCPGQGCGVGSECCRNRRNLHIWG